MPKFNPLPGERFKHYRTGVLYEVVELARHTERDELLVIYRQVEQPHWRRVWARPFENFCAAVELENGQRVPRFALQPPTLP